MLDINFDDQCQYNLKLNFNFTVKINTKIIFWLKIASLQYSSLMRYQKNEPTTLMYPKCLYGTPWLFNWNNNIKLAYLTIVHTYSLIESHFFGLTMMENMFAFHWNWYGDVEELRRYQFLQLARQNSHCSTVLIRNLDTFNDFMPHIINKLIL